MSSRRSRISLLGLGLTLAAGGHASAQIALDASRPFHRFADESEHAVPGGPTAVNVGWDYWTGLEQQKPVMAVDVRVPVDTKNTFRPGEHSPLAPSPAMRALLDDLRKSSEEARQRLEAAGLPSELTDTEREQLRSLGYVD